MQKDLTTGSVFKNVLYFSLPYLLSYFLQTLYGMADLFIIGQFEGTASITAVSIGSQIMHMITVMLVGLAMGITVGIGHAVGAGENRRAGSTIGNGAVLFLVLSAALAALRPRNANWADTVQEAKIWLSDALAKADSLEVGHGIGPVHHFHAWW